jgi:hypothetical protein
MSKFKNIFSEKMQQWQVNGKQDADVFSNPHDQICAFLWNYSYARQPEEKTPEVKEFALANRRVLGDAEYEKILRVRQYCNCCYSTYKIENLSICVDCHQFYCYRHSSRNCFCGGELVG